MNQQQIPTLAEWCQRQAPDAEFKDIGISATCSECGSDFTVDQMEMVVGLDKRAYQCPVDGTALASVQRQPDQADAFSMWTAGDLRIQVRK